MAYQATYTRWPDLMAKDREFKRKVEELEEIDEKAREYMALVNRLERLYGADQHRMRNDVCLDQELRILNVPGPVTPAVFAANGNPCTTSEMQAAIKDRCILPPAGMAIDAYAIMEHCGITVEKYNQLWSIAMAEMGMAANLMWVKFELLRPGQNYRIVRIHQADDELLDAARRALDEQEPRLRRCVARWAVDSLLSGALQAINDDRHEGMSDYARLAEWHGFGYRATPLDSSRPTSARVVLDSDPAGPAAALTTSAPNV